MKRVQRQCEKCLSLVSLSNFERHQKSKSCSNGGKNRTRAEIHPWKDWQVGEDDYLLPCGYRGSKSACRNALINRSIVARRGKGGNLIQFNADLQSFVKAPHNKGKKASKEDRAKLSAAAKRYQELNRDTLYTPERRKIISERSKKFYEQNPDKHPNVKLANNRGKMTYPERVAFDWFKEKGIDAQHNKKIGKFYPDFLVGNIIIEIDGERWHSSPEQKDKDRKRDQVLAELGYRIYRIPTKEHIETRLQEIFG